MLTEALIKQLERWSRKEGCSVFMQKTVKHCSFNVKFFYYMTHLAEKGNKTHDCKGKILYWPLRAVTRTNAPMIGGPSDVENPTKKAIIFSELLIMDDKNPSSLHFDIYSRFVSA